MKRNPELRPWRETILDSEYVPPAISAEMPDVVGRLVHCFEGTRYAPRGALTFMGAGMVGVVFCDESGRAYKVGRHLGVPTLRALHEESAWLADASRTPWVKDHVARFLAFDPENLVIARKCATGRMPSESRAFALHQEIQRRMLPDWRGVEFKRDSYVEDVLVDAGFPLRAGQNLLRYVRGVLTGRIDPLGESLEDMAYSLRMEIGQTITEDQATPLLGALRA